MKREELEALQLSKEQIDQIMDMNGKDINGIKSKMDSVQAQLAKANEAILERDGQLKALKDSTGDIQELKTQLEALQAQNAEKDSQYAAQMKDIKRKAAIKQMISGKVHDEELTASLFDAEKLIENEDGTWIGLNEQLQALQEAKKFLFKGSEEQTKPAAGFKFGTEPPANGGGAGADAALNAAFGLEQ